METQKVWENRMRTDRSTAELRPKILVVEDDTTSEPIWEYILDKAYKRSVMQWATSVGEADHMIESAFAEEKPFDLIVSDIFLSGSLTGIDLWHRFHARMPGAIVLMSAIDQMKVQRYFQGDSPIYLQKPLNMHDTIETVFELLQPKL